MASVSYWRDIGPLPGNVVWRVSVTGKTLALYLLMWYGECQLLA